MYTHVPHIPNYPNKRFYSEENKKKSIKKKYEKTLECNLFQFHPLLLPIVLVVSKNTRASCQYPYNDKNLCVY